MVIRVKTERRYYWKLLFPINAASHCVFSAKEEEVLADLLQRKKKIIVEF